MALQCEVKNGGSQKGLSWQDAQQVKLLRSNSQPLKQPGKNILVTWYSAHYLVYFTWTFENSKNYHTLETNEALDIAKSVTWRRHALFIQQPSIQTCWTHKVKLNTLTSSRSNILTAEDKLFAWVFKWIIKTLIRACRLKSHPPLSCPSTSILIIFLLCCLLSSLPPFRSYVAIWEIMETSQDTQFLQNESQHWCLEVLPVQALLTEETAWPHTVPTRWKDWQKSGLGTTPLLP